MQKTTITTNVFGLCAAFLLLACVSCERRIIVHTEPIGSSYLWIQYCSLPLLNPPPPEGTTVDTILRIQTLLDDGLTELGAADYPRANGMEVYVSPGAPLELRFIFISIKPFSREDHEQLGALVGQGQRMFYDKMGVTY